VDRIYHETMRRLGEPDFTSIQPKTLADLFRSLRRTLLLRLSGAPWTGGASIFASRRA
jgi:hypothetical protein